MRELYAVELRGAGAQDEAARIEGLVRQWACNPFEDVAPADLADGATVDTFSGSIATTRSDAGWLLRWTAANDSDDALIWHTQVALGPSDGDLLVTARIGIGQAPDRSATIGRLDYEFRSPAIVRTILRELEVRDLGHPVQPEERLVGASMVEGLVDFLCNPLRRLPVVVLTGAAETGLPIANPRQMSQQLAGLAHVVVLTSGLAGRRLTGLVGQERSVWLGGARIYWPGFGLDSDPYGHKLWTARRIQQAYVPLVDELRRWIGGLAAARTPEHPAAAIAAIAPTGSVDELPEWAQEYVDMLDRRIAELSTDLKSAEADLAARDERIADLEDQLGETKASFAAFSAATGAPPRPRADENHAVTPIASVRQAVDRAVAEAGDRLVFLDRARKSAYEFEGYNDPERMYHVLCDVAEASDLYSQGSLGMTLNEWFLQRGYEYSARNDAARSRKYERHYKVHYQDRQVLMEPHLKVDQSTSPDQCLRIYWYIDTDERIFVVGHAGRHLPPP